MGRGKRTVGVKLGTGDGRVRLSPRVSVPTRYGPEAESLVFAALDDAGLSKDTLATEDLDRVAELFFEFDGDDEERAAEAASLLIEEILEHEEETEECDRCERVVRAGHGHYFPEDVDDQERLCRLCYDVVSGSG